MKEAARYPSAEMTASQRELVARLVGPLQARGISRSILREILAEAHFGVSRASLDRWVRSLATGNVFTAEKASGAAPILNSEQCEIAAGWVLSQNESNDAVSLASFSEFCHSAFGVELGKTTAHDYLHALGFSSRVSQTKTSGYTIDVETLSRMMFGWKRDRSRAGDLKGLVASVDFTFTGHHTDRRVSYAPTGGAPPRSRGASPRFTNGIVTVVWSDGVNRTPPALFTFNGKFRIDRFGRKTWVQERAALDTALTRYGLEARRVIYLGEKTNEKRTYTGESTELLRQFFGLYQVPERVVVFSDNGTAFFPSGASGLEPLGFAKHIAYPAPVHQYLSPNDNRLHGAAKKRWRASLVDFKDDVESSLMLLHYLDEEIKKNGTAWFKQNIFDLTSKSAIELIRGRAGERAQVDYDRLQAYRIFMGLNVEGGPGVH